MNITDLPPINVTPLFAALDDLLMQCLHGMKSSDWQLPTVAKKWRVKDVVAHLLDGNIRVLSMLRDGYYGEKPAAGESLVDFLNGINADWIKAMQRVSPAMLVQLHAATGKACTQTYLSLELFEKAAFSVAWAGETESLNWMHLAREYTEKWLHQQQIRDALGDDTIMARNFFYPFIDTLMLALPYTFRNVQAAEGTVMRVVIPGDSGGSWSIQKVANSWVRVASPAMPPTGELVIEAGIAWKLFTNSIRPAAVEGQVQLQGDVTLVKHALSMVSIMA